MLRDRWDKQLWGWGWPIIYIVAYQFMVESITTKVVIAGVTSPDDMEDTVVEKIDLCPNIDGAVIFNDRFCTSVAGVENYMTAQSIPISRVTSEFWSRVAKCEMEKEPELELSEKLSRALKPTIESFDNVAEVLKRYISENRSLNLGEIKKLDSVDQARVLLALSSTNPKFANRLINEDRFASARAVLFSAQLLDKNSADMNSLILENETDGTFAFDPDISRKDKAGVFAVLGILEDKNDKGVSLSDKWKGTAYKFFDVAAKGLDDAPTSYGLDLFEPKAIVVRKENVEPERKTEEEYEAAESESFSFSPEIQALLDKHRKNEKEAIEYSDYFEEEIYNLLGGRSPETESMYDVFNICAIGNGELGYYTSLISSVTLPQEFVEYFETNIRSVAGTLDGKIMKFDTEILDDGRVKIKINVNVQLINE